MHTRPIALLRSCLAAALALGLALAATGAELPDPLVEFTFDSGLANTGTAGGAATLSVYAENEGPQLMPGPWGDCLDTTASSRLSPSHSLGSSWPSIAIALARGLARQVGMLLSALRSTSFWLCVPTSWCTGQVARSSS